jgi:endonuclease YncB( thermonuclease family)
MMRDEYIRRARLLSVHDGDTVYLDIDLGIYTWRASERGRPYRLRRVDAPELTLPDRRTPNPAGMAARDALRGFLAGKSLYVQTFKLPRATDIYEETLARFVIELEADGVNAADWLVANGHAAYRVFS